MQNVGFILLPGYALMSYASAVEPLRAVNLLAGQTHYRISHFSPGGGMAEASSGAQVPTRPVREAGEDLHIAIVCAGGDPSQWHYPGLLDRLRYLARAGVRVGGISGGPYVLAAAGVLANKRFTVHWEHAPALMEAYPDLIPEKSRFVIDGNRITCGGGVAPVDLMHALIAERMGDEFARRISDWYLHTHVGAATEGQRASLAETYGTNNRVLLVVLDKMENTPETPLDRASMARFAGVSERHLNRLFRTQLGSTYLRTYLRIRVEYAGRLLRQSSLSVAEVAMATGFSSASHFSRTYQALIGHPPSAARRQRRAT